MHECYATMPPRRFPLPSHKQERKKSPTRQISQIQYDGIGIRSNLTRQVNLPIERKHLELGEEFSVEDSFRHRSRKRVVFDDSDFVISSVSP